MISGNEFQRINAEHFKDNPNAVKFCRKCNLSKREYCSSCATRQTNRLDRLKKVEVEE